MKLQIDKQISSGFTLIELLVVIAIIGLLSSIILASLSSARTKAQYAVVNQEMKQIINAIFIAQQSSNKVLYQITNSTYSDGNGGCFNKDLRHISTSDACYTAWTNILNRVQVAEGSNAESLLGFVRDPWGSPYLIDENEHEGGNSDCRYDDFHSAGPDGKYPSGDDVNYNIPHYICVP